jgi:hypothetical protein
MMDFGLSKKNPVFFKRNLLSAWELSRYVMPTLFRFSFPYFSPSLPCRDGYPRFNPKKVYDYASGRKAPNNSVRTGGKLSFIRSFCGYFSPDKKC